MIKIKYFVDLQEHSYLSAMFMYVHPFAIVLYDLAMPYIECICMFLIFPCIVWID